MDGTSQEMEIRVWAGTREVDAAGGRWVTSVRRVPRWVSAFNWRLCQLADGSLLHLGYLMDEERSGALGRPRDGAAQFNG